MQGHTTDYQLFILDFLSRVTYERTDQIDSNEL